MTGKKTHEQQLRIIEKREKTANADEAFDAAADLHRNEQAKEVYRKGSDLKTGTDSGNEDRSIVRGRNRKADIKREAVIPEREGERHGFDIDQQSFRTRRADPCEICASGREPLSAAGLGRRS